MARNLACCATHESTPYPRVSTLSKHQEICSFALSDADNQLGCMSNLYDALGAGGTMLSGQGQRTTLVFV